MIYGIVKQNNGSILVYSEPDQGTTFKIYWPVSHQKKRKDTEITPVIEKLSGNETILVVEDDKEVCLCAANSLLSLGYHVYKAFNGEQALAVIRKGSPLIDLIITDLIMPELNGKEFAKKALDLIPDIKIIYVSGYTDNHIVHDGLLEEGVNFIQKPYSQQTLARMVRTVLDKKKDT